MTIPPDQLYDFGIMQVFDNAGSWSPQSIKSEIIDQDVYGLKRLALKPGDVVLDLGANIGMFTILAAKTWPGIKVFCFEPCLPNFTRLVKNLKHNGVQNVTPLHMAVGNGYSVRMCYDPVNTGGSQVCNDDMPTFNTCGCVRLDDFLMVAQIDRVALLKCDIEAEEYEVFPEFKSWHKIEHLSMEVHPPQKRHRNKDARALVQLLLSKLNNEPCLSYVGFNPEQVKEIDAV